MSVMRQHEGKRQAQKDPYLVQKVMSATPEQLISYVYDVVISACRRKDQDKLLQALMVLTKSLNFDYEDAAVPMYNLYRYCLERARKRKYDEVAELIGNVKSVWAEAMNVN